MVERHAASEALEQLPAWPAHEASKELTQWIHTKVESIKDMHERQTPGLEYHGGTAHIEDVGEAVEQTLTALGIGQKDRERLIARAATAGHDCVQVSVELPNGELLRIGGWGAEDVKNRIMQRATQFGRDPGEFYQVILTEMRKQGVPNPGLFEGNEKESFKRTRDDLVEGDTGGLIDEEFLAGVEEGIRATVPTFSVEWRSDLPLVRDQKTGTAYRPKHMLTNAGGQVMVLKIQESDAPAARPAALALALNDVHLVGRGSFEAFDTFGNREFRELKHAISEALKPGSALTSVNFAELGSKIAQGSSKPEDIYAAIAAQALTWQQVQIGLAWGQKELWLHYRDKQAMHRVGVNRQVLDEQFSQYDQNLIEQDEKVGEMLKVFGYLRSPEAFTESATKDKALGKLVLLLNDAMHYRSVTRT